MIPIFTMDEEKRASAVASAAASPTPDNKEQSKQVEEQPAPATQPPRKAEMKDYYVGPLYDDIYIIDHG